jgi:uncharacterized membrane protein
VLRIPPIFFLAVVTLVWFQPPSFRLWTIIAAALVCLFQSLTPSTARRKSLESVTVAVLPVVLGLTAMFAGYRDVNRELMFSASAGRQAYEAGRRQARVPLYIGGGVTAVILVLTGIRRRRGDVDDRPTL